MVKIRAHPLPACATFDDIAGANRQSGEIAVVQLPIPARYYPPKIEVDTVSLDDYPARGETPLSLMKIGMEGTESWILRGAADHRSILFYESFNYHAEIPALFQDYGHRVFESDCHQAIVPETSSFILSA